MTNLDKKFQDVIEAAEAVVKEIQAIIIIQKEIKQELDNALINSELSLLENGYTFEQIERMKNGEKIR